MGTRSRLQTRDASIIEMRTAWLLLLCFVAGLALRAEALMDGVRSLSDDSFNNTLSNAGATTVLFYAPWCENSQQFAPIYEETAKLLDKDGISAYKVDAHTNPKLR